MELCIARCHHRTRWMPSATSHPRTLVSKQHLLRRDLSAARFCSSSCKPFGLNTCVAPVGNTPQRFRPAMACGGIPARPHRTETSTTRNAVQIGNHVFEVFFLGQSGKNHPGAFDPGLRFPEKALQFILIPDKPLGGGLAYIASE